MENLVGDGASTSWNEESVTLAHTENEENIAKVSIKPQGGRLGAHDVEELYLRQRAEAPKDNIFNPLTYDHAKHFLEAMIVYQQSLPSSKTQAIDLSGSHSWDDVMRAAHHIQDGYRKAGQKGPRRLARFIAAQSESAVPFLRLVPNGFYESIVCGALRLIFEAATQLHTSREKVLSTLVRIPDVILQAEHSVETWVSDRMLKSRVEDLYVSILDAISGAAEYMQRNPFIKNGLALVRGQLYSRPFTEKIEALEGALRALQARASVLRDDAIVTTQRSTHNIDTVVNQAAAKVAVVDSTTGETLSHVRLLQRDTKDLKFFAEHNEVQLESVHERIRTFTKTQDTIHSKVDGVQAKQQETRTQIETLTDAQQAKQQAARAMEKAMEIALETAEWRKKDSRVIGRIKRQIARLEKVANGLIPADLLDMLNVNPEVPIEDARRVHQACQHMEVSDHRLVQGVFEGVKYRDWLTADESTALFVEGGSDLAVHGRFAALASMSVLVLDKLKNEDPAVTIHHFCNSHTSPKDQLHGPQGIMRSLICQVVRLFPNHIDLGFASGRRFREQLEAYSLIILCECFARIVKQLPQDLVLVCLIDSIDCFERHEYAEDCRSIMRELQDVGNETELGTVFKLLVTSVRSRYVRETFAPKNRILLADQRSTRDYPTERELDRGNRRPRARESDAFRSLRARMPDLSSEDGLSDTDFSWDEDVA